MQIKEVRYYDDETLDLVAERFFIDNEEVEEEVYEEFIGELFDDEVDVDEEEHCCECCGECDCEDKGITYGELLDVFVGKIIETQGCPGCIRDVLEEFSFIFINEEDE